MTGDRHLPHLVNKQDIIIKERIIRLTTLLKDKENMKKTCYILALLLFISCNDRKQDEPQLPYVKFTYLWPGTQTCCDLTEHDVLGWEDKADTIISDSCFYEKFTHLLNSIPNDTTRKGGDFRIVAHIYHKDSTVSVMCCDDVFGLSMVDNICKQRSPELMDFLNHLLYNEQGYRRLIINGIMKYDSVSIYTEEVQRNIDKHIKWLKSQGITFY